MPARESLIQCIHLSHCNKAQKHKLFFSEVISVVSSIIMEIFLYFSSSMSSLYMEGAKTSVISFDHLVLCNFSFSNVLPLEFFFITSLKWSMDGMELWQQMDAVNWSSVLFNSRFSPIITKCYFFLALALFSNYRWLAVPECFDCTAFFCTETTFT